jgi:hypothetical protein
MARDRSKPASAVVWVLAIIASLSFAFAYVVRPEKSDPYQFLNGQGLIAAGAMFPMDCYLGADESAYYLSEYRVYSWDGDYDLVKRTASVELEALGFRRDYDRKGFSSWSKPNHIGVSLQEGRSFTRDQAMTGKSPSKGVTVICGNEIPYTWVNRFRAFVEPGW